MTERGKGRSRGRRDPSFYPYSTNSPEEIRIFGLHKPIVESRRADSNRLPLLITSLLAYILACTGASGKCAYLCGHRHFRQGWLSTAY
jgi:hypothetical protein